MSSIPNYIKFYRSEGNVDDCVCYQCSQKISDSNSDYVLVFRRNIFPNSSFSSLIADVREIEKNGTSSYYSVYHAKGLFYDCFGYYPDNIVFSSKNVSEGKREKFVLMAVTKDSLNVFKSIFEIDESLVNANNVVDDTGKLSCVIGIFLVYCQECSNKIEEKLCASCEQKTYDGLFYTQPNFEYYCYKKDFLGNLKTVYLANSSDYLKNHSSISFCKECKERNIDGGFLFNCIRCNTILPKEQLEMIDKYLYCKECIKHLERCRRCNSLYAGYLFRQAFLCSACRSNEWSIHRHSEDVVDLFKGVDKNVINTTKKMLFGCELEIASQMSLPLLQDIVFLKTEGRAIFKHDGSIAKRNYSGFEIVTKPYSYQKMIEFWDDVLPYLYEIKFPYDIKSYRVGTCGFHIHINKSSLSSNCIAKMVMFLNKLENEPIIKTIAQRYGCNRYVRQKYIQIPYVKKALKSDNPNQCRTNDFLYSGDLFSKYEFLNITKKETVEFRIFKGTLGRERLISYLEFTESLINFCRKTKISNVVKDEYLNYLEINRHKYMYAPKIILDGKKYRNK